MTFPRSVFRRMAIIGIALFLAFELLRPELSTALVSRGDTLRYQGDTRQALRFYDRALFLDRNDAVAVDRFAFSALVLHDPRLERRAIGMISRALIGTSTNTELRYDRALCAQALGEYLLAEPDFEAVGRLRNDARAFLFAALDLRTRAPAHARYLIRRALAADPDFLPARRDLRRFGS